MTGIGTTVKVFIAITLISLLVFSANLTKQTYETFIGYLAGVPTWVNYVNRIGLVFWAGLVGVTARLAAVCLGLYALSIVWRKQQFFKARKSVATALILESVYFLGLIPSIYFLLRTPFFAAAYLLQVLFAVPLLIILSLKVLRYQPEPGQKSSLVKWAALTLAGYIAALWANSVLRWFDMISVAGLDFLLTGIRAVGFLSSVILMSSAAALAIIAVSLLIGQRKGFALKCAGLSFVLIGVQYAVYVVYSYFTNVLASLDLVDVWTLPLIGLGAAMVFEGQKTKQ